MEPTKTGGLTEPHRLAPAVMPIQGDGLEPILVRPVKANKPSPATPTVIRVSTDNKDAAPTTPKLPDPTPSQPPGVSLQKIGPENQNLGQSFRYDIVIRNPGTTALANLRIVEQLPEGAECLSVEPQAQKQGQSLIWDLGGFDAGAEKKLTVEVKQAAEGEFQSTATVMFGAYPWKLRVTRPDLKVSVKAPAEAQVGDEVAHDIQVTNPGSGPAANAVLSVHLPPGLQHPQGRDIEADLGALAPGQSRSITLKATAVESGLLVSEVTATADTGLEAKDSAEVRVTRAGLKVKKTGPEVAYLHHELEHRLEVSNNGQAPATSVNLTDTLPEGLDFLSATEGGIHDPKTRTVSWTIGTLPAGDTRTVTIKMKARATGDWINKATAKADRGLESTDSTAVRVAGVPALLLEVVDLDDPLEVGAETEYEVRVLNQGSSNVAGVSIRAVLPQGLAFVSAEGPSKHQARGQEILFEPMDKLAGRADALYRVRVKALKEGDWRFQVTMNSQQFRPVFEEESTQVYDDLRDLKPAAPPTPSPTRP